MGLIPYYGFAYTALLHFFSYDDKIKSAPEYDSGWVTNPSKWKYTDFIPETFSDTNTNDELFINNLIENDRKVNEGFSNTDGLGEWTPLRILILIGFLITIIVIRRMHGNAE